MSDYDEYEIAAAHRLTELNAARMQTITNMEIYRSQGDVAGMGEEVERLGAIDQKMQGIQNLYAQHQQSKMPVQQYQPSKEMLDAKKAEDCDWSDTWRMVTKDVKSPRELEAIRDEFVKGMAEVQRRKAMGV